MKHTLVNPGADLQTVSSFSDSVIKSSPSSLTLQCPQAQIFEEEKIVPIHKIDYVAKVQDIQNLKSHNWFKSFVDWWSLPVGGVAS